MGFKRSEKQKERVTKSTDNGGSPRLVRLGEWGNSDYGIRIVRLVSKESLDSKAAAYAVKGALAVAEEFGAHLLITPGGFGLAKSQHPFQEKEAMQAITGFVSEFLQLVPAKRSSSIILGVDTQYGTLQDAYFIPDDAKSVERCVRAWKSYPREDELRLVITKGRPCPNRTVRVDKSTVSMLVCHDLASFAKRSQVNRGTERERWAKQLNTEVARGADTGVVHLMHYLDKSPQGRIFASGMDALIKSGVTWGISAFKTTLNSYSDLSELQKIERRTARFAGETLDVYVA